MRIPSLSADVFPPEVLAASLLSQRKSMVDQTTCAQVLERARALVAADSSRLRRRCLSTEPRPEEQDHSGHHPSPMRGSPLLPDLPYGFTVLAERVNDNSNAGTES